MDPNSWKKWIAKVARIGPGVESPKQLAEVLSNQSGRSLSIELRDVLDNLDAVLPHLDRKLIDRACAESDRFVDIPSMANSFYRDHLESGGEDTPDMLRLIQLKLEAHADEFEFKPMPSDHMLLVTAKKEAPNHIHIDGLSERVAELHGVHPSKARSVIESNWKAILPHLDREVTEKMLAVAKNHSGPITLFEEMRKHFGNRRPSSHLRDKMLAHRHELEKEFRK